MATTSRFETLALHVEGAIARVTFLRDEQLNAYSATMLDEIERAVEAAEADAAVRVIVLRGSEKAFCAGADLTEILPLLETGDSTAFRERWLEPVHHVADMLDESRLVSIAVVQGFALAGGLELALACDLMIAADDARIGDQHLNFDLIPGGGASQRLVRAIGPQRAKLLLYTARWISGREAAEWGLAARAAPPEELDAVVEETVALVARRGPHALERTKQLVNYRLGLGLAEGLALERAMAADHMVSPEAKAGLDRFHARKAHSK